MADRYEEIARRQLTERELAIVGAMKRVTFPPATNQKRFAQSMIAAAERSVGITERQARYLTVLAWRFRRQMPAVLAYPMIEGDEGIVHGFEPLPPSPLSVRQDG